MPSFSYDFAGFGVINATSISATGAVSAGTTVTAGTGLTVTTGAVNMTASTLTAAALVGDVGAPGWLGPIITDVTGSLTLTSGRAYAQYLGEVPKTIASILATYYLHGVPAVAGGGGVSLNWSEVAIATGTLGDMQANTDLTVLGSASIDANAVAAGTQWYGTTITCSIPARTGLWLILASAYQTTQLSVRVPTNFLNARGYARTANAFQPSASVGTPTTFAATVTTGTVVPIMGAQWS